MTSWPRYALFYTCIGCMIIYIGISTTLLIWGIFMLMDGNQQIVYAIILFLCVLFGFRMAFKSAYDAIKEYREIRQSMITVNPTEIIPTDIALVA
jgi:hypothetical protein